MGVTSERLGQASCGPGILPRMLAWEVRKLRKQASPVLFPQCLLSDTAMASPSLLPRAQRTVADVGDRRAVLPMLLRVSGTQVSLL